MTYSMEEFEKAKGKILSKLLLPYISPAEEPQFENGVISDGTQTIKKMT